MGAVRNDLCGVMIVEDDCAVRETMTELLEEEGYQVTPVSNGLEALDRLRHVTDNPHLIILDLMMPVMDGCQFRAEMKRDPHFSDIPVVIMSADVALEQKARELSAAAVLPKPVGLDRLLETVRRYCWPPVPSVALRGGHA